MPMSKHTIVQYYDFIAKVYDEILDHDATNQQNRIEVARALGAILGTGSKVLDFGGGTGADWRWLLRNGYDVSSFEPSAGMKGISTTRLESKRVRRVDEPLEKFLSAEANSFDGILANFAVLNHIREIANTFALFSMALRQGGHVVIVLLNPEKHSGILRRKLFPLINKKNKIRVSYNNLQTTAYVHTIGEIVKAAKKSFVLNRNEALSGERFQILHFIKVSAN